MKRRLVTTVLGGCMLAATLRAEEPVAFFNGKDLTNWQGMKEYWSVKDGAIVGSTQPKGIEFNTFLCSQRPYKDFELSFQVKLVGSGANSGLQIRSKIVDKSRWTVWGPQCDMGEGWWGTLFGEHFGGAKEGDHQMLKQADAGAVKKVLHPDDFNDYYVKAVRKRVTIKINNLTTVDQEIPMIPDEGIIAFQLHSGGPMEATFKNLRFKELK